MKGLFPGVLHLNHQLKFFEPANTVRTEVYTRCLADESNFGVPDGI
jgi:hypothetical protein